MDFLWEILSFENQGRQKNKFYRSKDYNDCHRGNFLLAICQVHTFLWLSIATLRCRKRGRITEI